MNGPKLNKEQQVVLELTADDMKQPQQDSFLSNSSAATSLCESGVATPAGPVKRCLSWGKSKFQVRIKMDVMRAPLVAGTEAES
jgi:hypothetical protein